MRWFLRSTLLFLPLSATTAAVNVDDQQIQDLVDWVRREGGHVNEKLQIRRTNPSDPTCRYGIFALETIPRHERLLDIASSSTIQFQGSVSSFDSFDDDEDSFENICGVTQMLLKELRLGDKSKYAAYIHYLLGQAHGQIPATWSPAGKAMLLKGIYFEEPEVLDMLDWMEYGWQDDCIQKGDPFEIQALALVVQRGFGFDNTLMIPLVDMIHHSNDHEAINTETTSVHLDTVRVWASRDIPAGQELLMTYDHCADCGNVQKASGTQDLLRDRGFVEPYPRKFRLGGDEEDLLFSVHENKETKELQVTWINDQNESPDHQGEEFLKEFRRRLQGLLYGGYLEAKRDEIPKKEWDVIFEYFEAISTAVESAIYDLNNIDDEDDCEKDKSCSAPWLTYADLDAPIPASDDEYFFIYQSENLVYGTDHFSLVGHDKSHYQAMDYHMDPKSKEMCFFIDGVFQQCSSYRPHYHEMGVHLPARYLVDSLKRVLWIGGGDAMLLHEILKYPDLELTVGLELDQKVTRGAFQYFGVQPHFDNDKVQWWFGDASKSLLMLPEDYFGSFDMVLVDLSDTVLSLSVTKEMDIIGALSLLLKPDGIFAMNELFFKRVSQVFEHTVQIKFENVPKVCDQAFVFASNDINFLSRNLTGHQVENNIYIDPLRPEHYRFGLVHDYRRNHDSDFKKLCHKSDKDDGEVLQQEGSPGIFMAVEVEKVAMDLRSTKDVQKAVTKALEQEGFQVDSILKRTAASEFSGSPSDEIVLLLREGYVIIRTWAEHNYCAFDIHLWGSFEKHESAKKAVVASVGGKMKTTSSYRIVAGGMFGVSTWKDDAKANGPQPDKLCDPSEAPSRDAPLDPSTVEVALEAGLRLTLDEDPIIAAVVCGDAKACASIDLLKKNDKVGQVIVLMCPELKPKDELYQDGPERVIACEKEILKTFEESLTGEKLLGAIVLDAGASRLMGKILLKILSGSKSRSSTQILAPNMLAIATIDKEETESWRRNFLNEIRVDIVKLDPVFRAEILFNTTDHSMELGVTSAGDEHFVERLVAIVADVEKESGLSVEVREFHGGFWRSAEKAIMKDSDADFVFSHDSYDGAAAMEQWNSQQPLGHQSLFQFETRPLVVGDHVHALLEGDMSEGVVTLANSDNTYKIRFTEDGIFYKVVHRNNIRKLFGSPNDAKVTASQVKTALETALSGMPSTMILDAKVQELPSAGDGSVLAAFWSGGSILFMWDGRIHLDMNIFTFLESTNLPEKLALRLKQEISGLETILRDEQPRGYGRAVNFQKDVGKTERKVPFWA